MRPRATGGKRGCEVHRHLLSDPKVRAWYDERALRSRLSADTYLRQLGATLGKLKLTPSEFANLAANDPDHVSEALVSYAAALKREGRLDSYIAKTFDGLRSWLRSRRVSFEGFPKLSPVRGVTLEKERVPTSDELRRILDRLSPRGRASALLMAHSGLRPGVLGNYGAADGLTLEDLPELKLGKRPTFTKIPFVVRIPARLSKTRRMYTTFGTRELSSALLAYLDERIARGEKLNEESPAVTVDSFAATHEFYGKKGSGRFLTTKGIVFELRKALSAAVPKGVTWRPYVLRGYCSTRLLLAESQGKISRDLREAILGHDGGVAARYNVGKPWGEELLEDARAAYGRCEPFLSTIKTKMEPSEADLKRAILGVLLPESEIAMLDVSKMSAEAVRRLVTERLQGAQGAVWSPNISTESVGHLGQVGQPTDGSGNGFSASVETVVRISELKDRLANGWVYVTKLPWKSLAEPSEFARELRRFIRSPPMAPSRITASRWTSRWSVARSSPWPVGSSARA